MTLDHSMVIRGIVLFQKSQRCWIFDPKSPKTHSFINSSVINVRNKFSFSITIRKGAWASAKRQEVVTIALPGDWVMHLKRLGLTPFKMPRFSDLSAHRQRERNDTPSSILGSFVRVYFHFSSKFYFLETTFTSVDSLLQPTNEINLKLKSSC